MDPSRNNSGYDRRTVLKLAGLTGAAGLAGCVGTGEQNTTESGGDGGGGDGNSGDSDTPTSGMSMADSIEAWSWDVAAKSLDLTDEPYEDANGGSVTIKQFGRANMKDKFKSRLLSGTGAPAVATMESVDAAAWVNTNGLRDISDWIDEAGIKDQFVSGKWGPLSKDGAVYALPWDIGPVGVFYRKDVFDEHGLDASSIETWDQFIDEGKKLPDDVAMVNLPSNDYDGHWRQRFRQLGGVPFTKDGKVNIHSEKSRRVAENLQKLRDAGITSNVPGWSSEWFNRYGEGTIACLFGGAWMEGTLKAELGDTAGKWRVFKPPAFEKGGNRATNWGGSNLVIADQVSDEKARRGFDYMQFTLARKDMQIKMYQNFGIFPALETAYESEEFDKGSDFLGGQAAGRMFANLAPQIPSYNYTVDTPELTEAINTHFQRMMDGKVSPKEAVQAAAEQVADRTGREMA